MKQTFLEISHDIDQELINGFFKRVEKTNSCWNWKGSLNKLGYGQMKIKDHLYMAHRISYYLKHQQIDQHLTIDHLCKNTSCVNPEHLELVTQRENVLRSDNQASINAKKQHCLKGHELSGENLLVYKDGRRWCRVCQTDSSKKFAKRIGLQYFRDANKTTRRKLKEKFQFIKSGYCISSQCPQCRGIIRKTGGKCFCQCH